MGLEMMGRIQLRRYVRSTNSFSHPTVEPRPLPPWSTQVGTPLDHPGSVSISTAFHPALSIDGLTPDFILVSSDGVHFYVHRHRLLSVSMNRMGMLIPDDVSASPSHFQLGNALPSSRLSQTADVINVLLHIMYGISCLQYAPTLEVTEAALDALCLQYGVLLQAHAAPHLPLYRLLLSYAPFRPLDAYAVAARFVLEDAAVAASSHLLAYDLSRLPDAAAQKMGPLYLKRLFVLHQARLAALRGILFRPPTEHGPAAGCSPEQRQQLTRAWALAVAQLVWDVLPSEWAPLRDRGRCGADWVAMWLGVSTSALQSLLEPIGAAVTCPHCAVTLQRRVQEITYEWSSVKVTIFDP